MDGFLCVNKPQGPSSFQIVAQLRKVLGVKKIGHAGTLDPDASGVLVLAIGSATRLIQYLPNEPKVYQFGLQFGSQTDTLDSKGTVVCSGMPIPELNDLRETIKRFHGECLQVPPAYSAKKVNGIRAYKMARNGHTPSLEACKVNIYTLELINYNKNCGLAELQMSCSGGTYVRSLVRDLASELHSCGFASYIRRIRCGNFSIDQAMDINDIIHAVNYIIPAAVVLNDQPGIQLCEQDQFKLINGIDISLPQMNDSTVFAFRGTHLLAVLQWKQGTVYHPVTVFPFR
ncbi:MAG TPA: tRNA pseudouridine(55) synthase TruB [Chitinispirillaceae bacterium]|nr:tRNA pseudouridine(55) synthase TruB [Chitinispirillaceae bacterium]